VFLPSASASMNAGASFLLIASPPFRSLYRSEKFKYYDSTFLLTPSPESIYFRTHFEGLKPLLAVPEVNSNKRKRCDLIRPTLLLFLSSKNSSENYHGPLNTKCPHRLGLN
jgi:hypothetical protein